MKRWKLLSASVLKEFKEIEKEKKVVRHITDDLETFSGGFDKK